MELYNEMQHWGSWPEDLLPPPLCSSLLEEPSTFKPSSSWPDPGLDVLQENLDLDLSFLEVDVSVGDWQLNDPDLLVKPPPLPSPVVPSTPTVDSSFYLHDHSLADLFGQLDSPSLYKMETPPRSPDYSFQVATPSSTTLPSSPESSPQTEGRTSPDLPPSPPSTPSVPRVKPPRVQKRKPGRRQGTSRLERKRVQNKEAATRYRIKKRAETEALGDEVEALELRNTLLKEKERDLVREIGYMKGLVKEFRERAKRCALQK